MLHRITSLEELVSFLPALVALHKEPRCNLAPTLNVEEFVAELTATFDSKSLYYGQMSGSRLSYFIVVTQDTTTPSAAMFWLFYVHKDMRSSTNLLLEQVKTQVKAAGYKHVVFITHRITKSYDKWVKKFGARKHLLTYMVDLS